MSTEVNVFAKILEFDGEQAIVYKGHDDEGDPAMVFIAHYDGVVTTVKLTMDEDVLTDRFEKITVEEVSDLWAALFS